MELRNRRCITYKHIARFGKEAIMAVIEQADHLVRGYRDGGTDVPGLRRLAVGLRQFLSLDRRMPTCQLSRGSDMPSHTLGSAMANQRHRAFFAGMEELASIPDAGGPAASPRQVVADIGGRPHPGDGCSPVTGRQGGRPWRVLWASCGQAPRNRAPRSLCLPCRRKAMPWKDRFYLRTTRTSIGAALNTR
jgi:hypothetical protein